jgi:hypothetical protein
MEFIFLNWEDLGYLKTISSNFLHDGEHFGKFMVSVVEPLSASQLELNVPSYIYL